MKFAIVGNGHIGDADRKAIDLSDHVTRFNSPPAGHIYDGMKTTELVLANSSKQVAALARDGPFLSGPVFSDCQHVTLAFDRTIISRYMPKRSLLSRIKNPSTDSAPKWRDVAHARGKQIRTLDAKFYYKACGLLGIAPSEMRRAFPSTGFLSALEKLDTASKDDEITLYGFEHTGWKRHKWAAEEQIIIKLANESVLRFRRPSPSS